MIVLLPFPLWIAALILLDCGFIIFAIDDDDETWGTAATISVLVVLLVLQWRTPVKAFTYVYTHPLSAIVGVTAYFSIGACWSVVKWWFAEKARVRRAKRERGKDWRTARTQPATYKATVLVWIGYWPFSLVWTLINDPFKRLVRWIYDELLRVYQRITDHVWDTP
jgi:hypothetical protein